MTSPPERDFTFAFFDAARTEGYVVPRTGLGSEEVEHKTDGGMFSNENEDGNIVDTIRRLKLNESGEKSAKSSLLTREMLHGKHSDLFVGSDFGDKEITKSASDAQAIPSEHIQLNRLLDDYLLGTKGDRIMEQMEELISDELADTTAKSSEPAEKQPSFVSTDLFGDEESDPSLDALTSMADFEKYISEN